MNIKEMCFNSSIFFLDKKNVCSLQFLLIFSVISCFLLGGCSTTTSGKYSSSQTILESKPGSSLPKSGSGRGGYYQDDGPMDYTPEDLEDIPDAVPRVEPYAKGPNKPYTVFGKRYIPITDNRPYKVTGIGSWYGKKFHGNKTSSGELYDMFKMTAAHPTLPIPCYVRVTNVSTGKQVIVRVNDRGPFHSDRIIDLSYTAALKLGYLQQGSTLLEVERLLPDEIERINLAKKTNSTLSQSDNLLVETIKQEAVNQEVLSPVAVDLKAQNRDDNNSLKSGLYYLQLGAYQQISNAQARQAEYALSWAHIIPEMKLVQTNNYYRLLAGPFQTQEEASYAAQQIENIGLRPFVIKR